MRTRGQWLRAGEAVKVQSEYHLNGATRNGAITCVGDTLADAMTTAILNPAELTDVPSVVLSHIGQLGG
jgi:hypothetical protein